MGYKNFNEQNLLFRMENLERLKGLRIMDDEFMTKVFSGHPECIELVLRIILKDEGIQVLNVNTQVFAANLLMRSVRFDVFAKDSRGRFFNVEIQRADKGAGAKRARYHASLMDTGLLEKGRDPAKLPETYVIFITEGDVLNYGYPVCHVERWILEPDRPFDDEAHIIYVNGACRDDTPLGKLMQDFVSTQASDMHYEVLAERMRFFKETKEGSDIMCRAFEELAQEVERETAQRVERETAQRVERETAQRVEKETANNRDLKHVKDLMETMGLSAAQAMSALKIEADEIMLTVYPEAAGICDSVIPKEATIKETIIKEEKMSAISGFSRMIRFCADTLRGYFDR